MTMMCDDDTMKLYATSADDDHYGNEAEDDHEDVRQRFGDDDEEEEVTMTSDDDEELDEDENEPLAGTHAEDATIFTPPPSPVTSYEPATKPSELPVRSDASTSVAKAGKAAAKKSVAPA